MGNFVLSLNQWSAVSPRMTSSNTPDTSTRMHIHMQTHTHTTLQTPSGL